mmetsp:Transcript_4383/g.7225  ORF Transcript_4383/g.7225 Transcript_4383/m.7225 type:complete len:124 (-) Transcript_4383:475-846(-)
MMMMMNVEEDLRGRGETLLTMTAEEGRGETLTMIEEGDLTEETEIGRMAGENHQVIEGANSCKEYKTLQFSILLLSDCCNSTLSSLRPIRYNYPHSLHCQERGDSTANFTCTTTQITTIVFTN